MNVLANLVAAAVLYLLATFGGYLKTNPYLQFLACFGVAIWLLFMWTDHDIRKGNDRQRRRLKAQAELDRFKRR
ncbi:hypothetical protein AB0C04_21110 [Micromonospora sp. NPDC048909]|uniref:hypothetical protein n=1 Tax=Micromonospora sp. NPDC048909 TaxID=3155643 RepID=UPI0033E44E20